MLRTADSLGFECVCIIKCWDDKMEYQ